MAIECDHPRPALNLPGYVPPRLAWQVPSYIPDLPPSAARVIRDALSGVYQELTRLGQTRNLIPLQEDLEARPGSVIAGVGDGQTITLLPPGADGYLDPVSVLLTDVESPVTVLHPDGTVTTLGEPGSYDFTPASTTEYETNPGGLIVSGGVPTDRLLGRDSAGTGAVEFIALTAPLEFDGAGAIRIATNGIGDSLIRQSVGFSVIGRAGTGTGNVADIALDDLSVLGRAGVLGTNVAGINVPGTGTFTGESVFLRVASTRLGIQWRPWTLVDMPEMATSRFVGNVSGATARPTYTSFGDLSSNSVTFEFTGETFIREQLDGDVFAAQNDNVTLIQPNVVTDAKLRDSGPLSVIGRAVNSTGDPADISAVAASGAVLRESGSTLGFGTIATAGLADNSVTDAKLRQSAGLSVIGRSASTTGNVADITAANDAEVLRRSGTSLGFGQVATAGIADDAATNAKLANMAQSTVKGRAVGAGTGDPQDLTAAQVRAIVDSAPIAEVEETGAGPFNDYAPATAGARHIMASNAAGVFTGLSATNYVVGDWVIFSHQGTGYTEFQHNTGSASGNVFFTGRQGRNLRIFDNELAVFRYVDTVSGATTITRWELQSPLFPWAQSSADAAGDVIAHNGTNYVAVAGGNSADVVLRGNATFGTVSNAALANMAAGTVKGRQVDAATGAPVDLTGDEVGELLRRFNSVADSTSSGTIATYAVLNTTTQVRFTGASAATLAGATATSATFGKTLEFHVESGAAAVITIAHESASAGAAGERFRCPGGQDLILRANESAIATYWDNRWRVTAVGRQGVRDADYGDVTVTTGGTVWTIDNNVVSDAKLRDSGPLSVIGRAVNSTGDPADISAVAASGAVLRESGSTLGFGTIATAGLADDAVTNAKLANMAQSTVKGRAVGAGTGDPTDLTGLQTGDIVRLTSGSTGFISGTFNDHAVTDGVHVLDCAASGGNVIFTGFAYGTSNTGAWFWLTKFGSSNTITIAHDSASSLAANRVSCPGGVDYVLSRSGDAVLIAWNNTRLQIVGAMHLDDADRGDVTVSNGGATWTIDNNVVSNAKLRDSAAVSVIGRAANSTGDPADIAAGANDRLLARTSDSLAFQQLTDGMVPTNTIALTKLANILDNRFLGNISGATGAVTATDFGSLNSTTIIYENTGKTLIRQALTGDVTALQNSNATTIANDAVTLAKMADLAQSRIIGRAEGAGTGDPTALTPAQVAAIIDGEAITWTGSHTFNGANFTVTASADVGITANGGTVTLAANTQVQITSPTRLASSTALDSVGSSAATGTVDNLTINSVSVVRFTGPPAALSGMVPVVDGQVVLMINAHASTDMGVLLESTSSTAANRFAGVGTSRNIKPGEMALAWYDGASDRWRLLCRDDADL